MSNIKIEDLRIGQTVWCGSGSCEIMSIFGSNKRVKLDDGFFYSIEDIYLEKPKEKVKKWLWAYQNGDEWRLGEYFYSEDEVDLNYWIKLEHTLIEVEDE